MERPLALVVDRDPTQRTRIRDAFETHGVVARGAESAAETTEALRNRAIGFLVIDVETSGLDVENLMHHAARLAPAPVVVVVTRDGDGRAGTFVEWGAFDILQRPFADGALQIAVRKALGYRKVLDELRGLREELQSREGYHGIVGRNQSMERLRERLEWLASEDVGVWFQGESGSGKELAARTLHRRSKRSAARFAVLSCADLEAQDWSDRLGLDDNVEPRENGFLAGAAGGTVYLDGLSALAPALQTRLLVLLDHPSVRTIDLRVLASSKADPVMLAAQGHLLEELRERVANETIALPPLRERIDDVGLLARHFITTICAINHLPPIRLASDALELLERYRWPENVQELRNAMEQAVILSPDGTIRPRDLPDRLRESLSIAGGPAAGDSDARRPFREAKRVVVESFERSYLSTLMERHGGNVTAASQRAGMLRSALQRLLRKYGLKSASFRRPRVAPKPGEPTRPER